MSSGDGSRALQRARATALLLLMVLAASATLLSEAGDNPAASEQTPGQGYHPAATRPPPGEVFRGVLADSVGPYSIFLGMATAGIHQGTDNPPEWRQGFPALSERFVSNIGISTVGNSARYALGWAMNADFRAEKCACKGTAARLGHAVKSTAVARFRKNGHAVLSVPNLVAPYAATTSAVYAWYPARYGLKDAFRMGNYNLLGTLGSNIVFEFIPEKALRFLRRAHLSGPH